MMRSARCGVAAFLLFLVTPAFADDEVSLTREAGVFHVRVRLPVAADINTAWQVITDYDHIADFVPGMKTSRVINNEPLEIEQTGNTGFLIFNRDFDVVMDLTPMPAATPASSAKLEFNVTRGAKAMHGYWNIISENAGSGIELEYVADIEPDFWVPPLVGTALMKRQLRKNVEAVAAEISRRFIQKK